ncbi:MAG: hypothetical protein Q9170_006109 [Blastenia crenularia]
MDMMDALSMTKTECLKNFLQQNGDPYDKIVTGAIITKRTLEGNPEILLLKRAAHEKDYPNVFEIPGGKVEDSDENIEHAVKREVLEETGMSVKQIIGAVKSFDYSTEKETNKKDGEKMFVRSTSLQFNFVCEVINHGIVVNLEEHSEGKFVDRLELGMQEVTKQMHAVVEEGFMWLAEHPFAGQRGQLKRLAT